MDRETLYLDNDEEITSVVDKLKGTDHVAIDLVIPKEALLTQSVVNLKILKKQAEAIGKEITIVTQDKVGKKLAEQVGIPVIEKPGEEPKVVHMTEGENTPKDDIEIMAKKPTKEKAALAADGIEMKPGADSPLEPTQEVIPPVAPIAAPDVEIPSSDIKNPADAKKKKLKKMKIIGLVGGFVALALLILGYIFIPLSNIEMVLAAEKKKLDFNFTADKGTTEVDSTAQKIPAKQISEEVEKAQKFPATGKKKIGEKAKGTVKIHNRNYSSDPFTISSGSRIVTSAGLVYRTTTNVTVPKFTKIGSNVTEGVADVSVQADEVGEKYNVVGGTMAIPGLAGATIADVYAVGGTAFTGGNSKDVQFVTQTDVNAAKEEMKKQLEEESKRLALEKTDRTERFLDGAIKIEEISAEPSVTVNGEATEFELKAKSKFTAIVFKDDDLKKLAESVLGDQIGSGKEIAESENLTSEATFVEGNFETGTLEGRLSGEAYIATKVDQEKLKIELTNEPEERAFEILREYDGVLDVKIKHFPSFYKRMPKIKNNIFVKTEISKNQEN